MDHTSSLAARMTRLLSLSDVKAREASRLAGLPSEAYVGMVARGDIASPQVATLAKIALALGADPGWLAFGTGPEPTADTVRAAVERARHAQDPNAVADDAAPLAAVG